MLNISEAFQKANPNHDEKGRFATSGTGGASLGFKGNADNNVRAMDYMDQLHPSSPQPLSLAQRILVNRIASPAGGYLKWGNEPAGGTLFQNSWGRKAGQPKVFGYGVDKAR
jgi:hypothetical protein